MTTHTESIPEGIFSKETLFCSRIESTFLQKPSSVFIIAFSIEITVKFFLPAIPVSVLLEEFSLELTINVPLSSGALVFFMFIGIPAFLAGKTASSCNTDAPIYDNSRSSLYVIFLICMGCSTILGSAIRNPDTSVQFSYKSALILAATNAPVTSDPPLEKVTILPSGSEP